MHKLLSPMWLAKHAFALLILISFIWLGVWQLNRLDTRRAENAALIRNYYQTPATLSPVELDALDTHTFEAVVVRGTFDNAESIFLRNQTLGENNGVHLITPLRLNNRTDAVLVDRGWLPQELANADALPNFAVAGTVEVRGIVLPSNSRPADKPLAGKDLPLPGETRIQSWLRVDIPLIKKQLPYPLLPAYIQQLPADNTPSDAYPRPLSPEHLDEGPHLGYALQWFTFAAILVMVYALLIWSELRKEKTTAKK